MANKKANQEIKNDEDGMPEVMNVKELYQN